jgi:type II secretory pathway pseudopilin PulG
MMSAEKFLKRLALVSLLALPATAWSACFINNQPFECPTNPATNQPIPDGSTGSPAGNGICWIFPGLTGSACTSEAPVPVQPAQGSPPAAPMVPPPAPVVAAAIVNLIASTLHSDARGILALTGAPTAIGRPAPLYDSEGRTVGPADVAASTETAASSGCPGGGGSVARLGMAGGCIVIPLMAIIAAIAIPNLLESRPGADEVAARNALATVVTAQQLGITDSTGDPQGNTAGEEFDYKGYRSAAEPEARDASATRDFLLVDQVLGAGKKQGYVFQLSDDNTFEWKAEAKKQETMRSGTRFFYIDENGIWLGGKPPAIQETYEETINRMWSDGMLTPEEQAWIDQYEEAMRRLYEMEFHAPFGESPYFSERDRRWKIRYEAEERARGATISASTASDGGEAILSIGVIVPSEIISNDGSHPSRSDLLGIFIGTSPPPLPPRGRSFTIDESGNHTYTDEREHAAWQAQQKAARQIVLDLASDDPARQEIAKENLRFANVEVKEMALTMATNWGISQAQTIADAIAASLSVTALSASISF